MKVKAMVNGVKIVVPCGDGDQTVKWLGLVVAQRYNLQQPHGRTRMREDKNVRRGFLLPKMISHMKGATGEDLIACHPNAMIKDVLPDGCYVKIELQEQLQLDDIGAALHSQWFRVGFCTGEASQRQEFLAKQRTSSAGSSVKSGAPSAQSKQNSGGFDVTVGSSVIVSNLGEGIASQTLETDWRTVDIRTLVPDPNEARVIRLLLQTYSAQMGELFSFFCGPPPSDRRGAMRYGMTPTEFTRALHCCGIVNAKRESDVGFASSAYNAVMGETAYKLMSLHEFGTALVWAAKQKGGGKVLPPLEQFLTYHIEELSTRKAADECESLLTSNQFSSQLAENRTLIKSVFKLYTHHGPNSANSGISTEEINLQQFCQLIIDSGVMGAILATADGKKRFEYQSELCFNAPHTMMSSVELSGIVFGEFLSSVVRLAKVMLEDSMPLDARVILSFDAIMELGLGDSAGMPHVDGR